MYCISHQSANFLNASRKMLLQRSTQNFPSRPLSPQQGYNYDTAKDIMQTTLTFFPHADREALVQPAVAALVALVLVDAAAALKAARVDVLLADRATEEALAAVARLGAVVLPGRAVAADGALGPCLTAAAGRGRSSDGRGGSRDGVKTESTWSTTVSRVEPRRVLTGGRDDRRHLGEVMRQRSERCWISQCQTVC